jgi:hypothetical protein
LTNGSELCWGAQLARDNQLADERRKEGQKTVLYYFDILRPNALEKPIYKFSLSLI